MPPRADVPVLETERLILRGHRAEDFDDCLAMWTDPSVTRFIGGRPSTREEVWGRMLRYVGHWQWLGYGYWIIEERATGDFVGEVGYADYKRTLEPPIGDRPEMGWALAPGKHGRGFASEAVGAAAVWSDGRFGTAATVCIIAPENKPSLRVAEKAGFREACRTIYLGEPTILFERHGKG